MVMPEVINVVDLFCGCGGLSLGFELFTGLLKYRTVIALDNDPSPVKCFNANSHRSEELHPTARLCDIAWFSHPSEVLLYYLSHYALWIPDVELRQDLYKTGFNKFLTDIHAVDAVFEIELSKLLSLTEYQSKLSAVDTKIFSLAISKAFFSKIGISSLKTGGITATAAPWREEFSFYNLQNDNLEESRNITVIRDIEESLDVEWNHGVNKLEEASSKEGFGQHSVVAERLRTLVRFLKGRSGERLKEIWVKWRSQRDSIRASFCMAAHGRLSELYTEQRQAHLVLGGPPCKGFSRIGRAVIESLRNQGVHAWTCKEYGDERNALLHKYVLFLEALRPDVFIFENVSNFKSALKTPAGILDASEMLERSIEDLSNGKLHYAIKSEITKAPKYAVPQDRHRFIMVGFNNDKIDEKALDLFFNLPSYPDEVPLQLALQGLDSPQEFDFESPARCKTGVLSKAYTLVDLNMPAAQVRYITWIRQPAPNSSNPPTTTDAHVVRKLRPDDSALIEKFAPSQRWMDYKVKKSETLEELIDLLKTLLHTLDSNIELPISREKINRLIKRVDDGLLLRLIMENAASKLDTEHHLLTAGYLTKGDGKHGDWFERLTPNQPSKTIVAHIGKDTYGYIHPYENRAISIREAARIQSFPDFFSFGNLGVVDGYTVIGNAVPPLLAYVFASQLANMHKRIGVFGQQAQRQPMATKAGHFEQLTLV
jgi:site-specific DNA-cytosine methylase